MGLIINRGDKLTKEDKKIKQMENKEKYGLSEEFVENMKLPPPTEVKIFSVSKIINAKVGLSTIEKIEHLLGLERALLEKLTKIKARAKAEKKISKEVAKLKRTSSIEEDYGAEAAK